MVVQSIFLILFSVFIVYMPDIYCFVRILIFFLFFFDDYWWWWWWRPTNQTIIELRETKNRESRERKRFPVYMHWKWRRRIHPVFRSVPKKSILKRMHQWLFQFVQKYNVFERNIVHVDLYLRSKRTDPNFDHNGNV